MEEIWKDIPGFEGLYQVSNMGRVRSLSHITKCGNYTRTTSGRILKQNPDLRGGYFLVYLSKNGKVKCLKVHRLVASCFCDGYVKGYVVNHKDGNRQNNIYTNLEWCKQIENINHSINVLNNKPGCGTGSKNPFSKPIVQLSMDGKLIKRFAGLREAERETGINSSGISKVLLKKTISTKGFFWVFEEDFLSAENDNPLQPKFDNRKISKLKKEVYMCDENSKILRKFKSVKEAGDFLCKSPKCISACANGKTKSAYGYKWIYAKGYYK